MGKPAISAKSLKLLWAVTAGLGVAGYILSFASLINTYSTVSNLDNLGNSSADRSIGVSRVISDVALVMIYAAYALFVISACLTFVWYVKKRRARGTSL